MSATPFDDTDEVYPVHKLDDTPTLRGIIVTWTLRFDDVLDPDHLHRSLWQLLEIGDWRKLGGRLRLTASGRLEIHAPRAFTPARPPVTYTHRAIPTNLHDDPLGARLPAASAPETFHPGPRAFQSFAVRADAPTTLAKHLARPDTPQLSLHITSFADATLVGLSWPHTLMDVMGQQALLRAWSLVVNGRAAEVPPVLGAREDLVAKAVAHPDREAGEPFALRDQRLGTFGMIGFGLRFAWTLLRGPPVEERMFYLSQRDLATLMREAQADLAAAASTATATDLRPAGPFVSPGDVLTAFFCRALARSLPSPRPLTALHALNLRFRIPAFRPPDDPCGGVFVQNMAIGAFLLLPSSATGPRSTSTSTSTAATASLGAVALANRHALAAQATEPQARAYLREVFPADPTRPARDPATVLCGPADAVLVPLTNWDRADFAGTVDFRGAVVGEDGEGEPARKGKLVYQHASSMVASAGARNVFVVLGRDQEEGWWCLGVLEGRTWEVLEAELKRLRGTGGRDGGAE